MTKQEALESIANTDYEPEGYAEAAELFTAIFGRKPDAHDGDAGTLFSHCCAAAPVHQGALIHAEPSDDYARRKPETRAHGAWDRRSRGS